MIFETSLTNKENQVLINDIVGRRFSFFESLKLNGVGSKRMMIENVSANLEAIINKVADINYGNIELRQNGIIVHINKGLKTFSWAIPYYLLSVYQSNGFSIHAEGMFVRFKNNKLLKENRKFLLKLMDLKTENQNQFNFQY